MAGYVAMARVEGGRVRTLAWDGGGAPAAVHADARPTCEVTGHEDCPAPTMLERWTWFREELGMMTFFLLDPESWR